MNTPNHSRPDTAGRCALPTLPAVEVYDAAWADQRRKDQEAAFKAEDRRTFLRFGLSA